MNNFRIFIILAIIVTTVLVGVLNPQIHKRVVIGDFDIALNQENNQPTMQKKSTKQSKKIINEKGNVDKPTNKQAPKFFSPPLPNKKKVTNEKAPTPQTIQPPTVTKKTKQLTPEEEEIIAWNNWRSALQNRVMKDSKLRAPIGTVFRFSFTVDRYGTISNLKTWSDNSQYTPMAVQTIKPRLLSYQGQSILNFPPKSKRVITNVNGEFVIWYSSGYSSPSDYSDYERVK